MPKSSTRPFAHLAAEAVSFITNPALVIVAALGLIVFHYDNSSQQFWHRWLIASFLLTGPGLIFSAFVWAKEGKVDIDITNREDRLIPLLLSTLGAVIGSFLVFSHVKNSDMLLLSYILVAMLLSLTLITAVWKISLHAATITALATLLVLLGGPKFFVLYLLVIPVAWARLTLKQHTWPQLIGGTLMGVGVTAAAILIFGR